MRNLLTRYAARACALFALSLLASAATAETLMMPARDGLKNTQMVVWGVSTQANGTAFTLDYGDGSLPTVGNVVDRSYIAFTHTYADAGAYTATLTVGLEVATVPIQVFDGAVISAADLRALQINMAIQDGLRFLWTNQTSRAARFPSDATTDWAGGYSGAHAALVVLAFENHGYKLANDGSAPTGIYEKYVVRRGLNYLVAGLTTIAISSQASGFAGQPVRDPCVGAGIEASPCTGLRETRPNANEVSYTTGVAMLPLAASGALDRVNTEVAGYTNGKTYREILQRLSNALAWGQIDQNSIHRGGWYYTFNVNANDNSIVGWDVLGFLDAEAAGITVPAWVKTEFAYALAGGLNTDGTLDYRNNGNAASDAQVSPQKNGTGLMGLFFIGETSGARVTAVTSAVNSWWGGATGTGGVSWGCDSAQRAPSVTSYNKGCAYTMFNNFKGLKLQGITTLAGVTRPAGPGAIPAGDWYADYQDWLVANQAFATTTGGGHWQGGEAGKGRMGFSCCGSKNLNALDTAIAELILSGVALVLPDEDKFASVGLTPPTHTATEGGTHTVTAHAETTSGAPVPGATVNFTILSGPNVGLVGIDVTDANGDATFTYTDAGPDGTAGTDRIQATIGALQSNIVNMIWLPKNQPPVAGDDASSTWAGTAVTVTVLANDSDPDPGQTLTVSAVSGNTPNGTVTINPDGSVTYVPNDGFAGTDVFSYTITDDFGATDTATVTIDVTKRLATVTAATDTKVYGDADPALPPTSAGFLPADGIALSASRDAGEGVGAYATHATAAGAKLVNYDVTYLDGVLTITTRAATVTAATDTKVYGDADPALPPTSTGFLAADSITLSASRDAGENVGVYATHATAAGAALGNYDVTYVDGALTITARAATVTAATDTKVYGDADPALPPTSTGFLAADSITLSASRDAGENVGVYATHATAAGAALPNYDVTYVDGSLTITKRVATVTAVTTSKVYGDADPSLTPLATGFLPADGIVVSGARDAGENVGSYATHGFAAGDALGNYDVSYTAGTLTITKRVATVTAVTTSKIYGSPDPTLEPAAAGFLGADGIVVTGSRDAGENVGSYATSGAAAGAALGNYDVTYVGGTLTITKKAATVTAVTASKVYGDADPSLTPSAEGFLASDGIVVTGSRDAGENVGTHQTHGAAAGGTLANYDVTYIDGVLTITPATLTVQASSVSVHYGDPGPAITPLYSGFQFADGPASLTVQPACSSAYTPTTPVGTIPTTCAGGASPDYDIVYVPGTLTVTNTAPSCDLAAANILTIWPPNHKWVPISVVGLTDADGDPLTVNITGIFQDEPTNSYGDGNTPVDGQINGSTALVRAERQGKKDGRVYHIRFTAVDPAGASCSGEVTACVPHDQGRWRDDDDDDRRWDRKRGRKKASVGCTDGGALYDSLVATPKPKPDHDPRGCKDGHHSHGKDDHDEWDRDHPKDEGGKSNDGRSDDDDSRDKEKGRNGDKKGRK